MQEEWIDLVSYATKYGVSQSTLRRRIRAKSIPFKMERGRYMLPDTDKPFAEAPLYVRSESAPAERAPKAPKATTEKLPADPVEAFLAQPQVLPIRFKSEFEQLQADKRRLQNLVNEQEMLIRALEAELQAPHS